jgi:undecaprenyl-diphosphatase
MISGGVLLLFVDHWFKQPQIQTTDEIDYKRSFNIGLFQCLAIILPGLSRSAATILGGMSQKISRQAAAEFSFFLAVPTMFAATGYKSLQYINEHGMFTSDQLGLIGIGNLVAFVVALLAIKFFINYVKEKGFRLFGMYRIILGIVVLILLQLGLIG